MTELSSDIPFFPYLLERKGPRLHGRTYLPVEALPIELEGHLVGWVWWNDDDSAANCEPVRAAESEPGGKEAVAKFAPLRWLDSIERRVDKGSLPSEAVADIRANGLDEAPRHRGDGGAIPPAAAVVRLPFQHFLHQIGVAGPRRRPRNDDFPFQLADSYADTVPNGAPITCVRWERQGVVMGWIWWNDELGASWHVPNVTQPGSRTGNGELIFNHPWSTRMKDLHDKGLPPGEAIREVMKHPRPELQRADHVPALIPPQEPWRTRTLEELRDLTRYNDYWAAEAAYMADWRAELARREVAEQAYYREHPEDSVAPQGPAGRPA